MVVKNATAYTYDWYCHLAGDRTWFDQLFNSFSVPPKRPLILNEKGHKVESMVGPFNEGASLRITCISDKEGKLSFLASGAATLAVTTLRITTFSLNAYMWQSAYHQSVRTDIMLSFAFFIVMLSVIMLNDLCWMSWRPCMVVKFCSPSS